MTSPSLAIWSTFANCWTVRISGGFFWSEADGMERRDSKSPASSRQTTHFGFYKITISHGIVIDPRHPEEATVFALLVNPKELDNLKEQLNAALPDSIEETPVDPRIVTQLADIGQVQACPATPGVTIPTGCAVAMRTKGAGRPGECRGGGPDSREAADRRARTERPGPPGSQSQDRSCTGRVGNRQACRHARADPAHSPEPMPGHEVLKWPRGRQTPALARKAGGHDRGPRLGYQESVRVIDCGSPVGSRQSFRGRRE